MFLVLGGFGIILTGVFLKYLKLKKDYCLPYGTILTCSDMALKATYEKFENYPVTRLSPTTSISHRKIKHTLIDLINPKKLPKYYLGRFMDHLIEPGNPPKYLKRVTLAAVKSNHKVVVQYTSNESHLIIHFNPSNIRADLLASYINFLLAALPRGL